MRYITLTWALLQPPGGTQSGTIRTNCLDCLDRTNSVQAFFALEVSIQIQETQTHRPVMTSYQV